MINEFKAFLTKSNALALAIGVIIGAAVANVVSALSADVLMPIIGLLLPGGSWRDAKIVLGSVVKDGKVTENAILYGHFLGTMLDFVIIALIVFMITKSMLKPAPAPAAEKTKKCPECLDSIPESARRCRACTAVLVQV